MIIAFCRLAGWEPGLRATGVSAPAANTAPQMHTSTIPTLRTRGFFVANH